MNGKRKEGEAKVGLKQRVLGDRGLQQSLVCGKGLTQWRGAELRGHGWQGGKNGVGEPPKTTTGGDRKRRLASHLEGSRRRKRVIAIAWTRAGKCTLLTSLVGRLRQTNSEGWLFQLGPGVLELSLH